jgi:hypothetical protein
LAASLTASRAVRKADPSVCQEAPCFDEFRTRRIRLVAQRDQLLVGAFRLCAVAGEPGGARDTEDAAEPVWIGAQGLLVFGQRIGRLIDLEQKVGTGAMSITSVRTRDRDDAPKPCVDLQKFDDLFTKNLHVSAIDPLPN